MAQPAIAIMVPDRFTRPASIARILIDAALANEAIQKHLADSRLPSPWTIEGVRRNPTCRMEWEHVIVIGGIGEALAAARHKNWGEFIGVLPLMPDDPVHRCRLLYLHKATSPFKRRFEQRRALKRTLGRKHRSLVTLAVRSTKRDFLAALPELGARVIKCRLRLEPGQFWRVANGRYFVDRPSVPVQLLLFDDGPVSVG